MEEVQGIKQRIEEYLIARFPHREELSVGEVEQVRIGASHGIFMFNASWKEAQVSVSEGLVLRMEPDIGLVPPYDIRPEYEVMKRIHGAGIPVPKVHLFEEDSRILGRPFVIMEKIEGGERLFDTWVKQPDHRYQLMKDYVSILPKIHGLNWQALDLSFLGIPENDCHFAENEIARWEKVVEDNQYTPYPIMAELFSWLKRNIPPAKSITLCHGDYSVFNTHARDGRVIGVLDWEMAGIGDPVSDIGWACFFGKCIGMPDWDETIFIHAYEEMTGEKVNEDSFFFWKVLAHVKMMAISIGAIKAGIESKHINIMLMTLLPANIPSLQDEAARMLGF